MARYLLVLPLIIATVEAKCPALDPQAFRETLNNDYETMTIDGVTYKIKHRQKPGFAIKSTEPAIVEIAERSHDFKEVCIYTRRVSGKKFGSFVLEKRKPHYSHHRESVIILPDSHYRKPVITLPDRPRHHYYPY